MPSSDSQLCHPWAPSCAVSRALSCGITASPGHALPDTQQYHPWSTQLCHPQASSSAIPSTPAHATPGHLTKPSWSTQEWPPCITSCAILGVPDYGITKTPGCGISRYPTVPLPRHSTMAPLGHLAMPSPEHLAVLTHSQVHINTLGTPPAHRLIRGEPTCHCHFPMSLPTVAWWTLGHCSSTVPAPHATAERVFTGSMGPSMMWTSTSM